MKLKLDVRDFYAFMDIDLPQYEASICPLCAAGKPINTDYGHGRAFVEEHGQPIPFALG